MKATDEYKESLRKHIEEAKKLLAKYEEKCKAANVCLDFIGLKYSRKESYFFKPIADGRFLSLPYAMVGFSSCSTQQIFIVARNNF